jgi:type IV pilus assembly protein PilB
MKKKRLGEILRERGHVTAADLDKALRDQQAQDKLVHLGELLFQRGVVPKKDLVSALSLISSIPYLDCTAVQVEPQILNLIPSAMAARSCVLPVGMEGTGLVVVMAEPQNLHILDELRFKTGKLIVPRLGFRKEIETAIEKYYHLSVPLSTAEPKSSSKTEDEKTIEFISSSEAQRNIEAMREMQSELNQKSKTTPAVMLVASMIRAAAAKGASDIHIEPQASDTSIRFRVDGILREYQRIPRALQNTVASRIKILSDMDISERRVPQDGRFLVRIADRRIDMRISTLPTQYGEKVVLRLLESSLPSQDFSKLGFSPWKADRLKSMLNSPQGMILVTGPTGSGKSTTLYAALTFIRKPAINIITVEDPIEYAVPGLNQVQVNIKAGVTFANSLRSILRQDPNVIMIGEIRDAETAEIALKSAQTGHLVLSTLHTNDSLSAVTRLLDLGMPAFQIAASMTGIIAQRLVRKLCSCCKSQPPTPEFVSQLLQVGIANPPAAQFVPVGCESCDGAGYRGRVGIYEMLVFDDAIRTAVREGGGSDELRLLARRGGMRFMQEYALQHVREGLTTLDEVLRVVLIEHAPSANCESCNRELSPSFLFCPFCGVKTPDPEMRKSPQYSLIEQGAVNQ